MVSVGDARFTNTDFVTEFIEIYRTNTCLWQVKSADYSNRDKRASAYQKLVDLCQTVNINCDILFVKKKIANLRNAFRKEHSKVRNSTKSCADASGIYVPKLWYYKLLEFTADHEEPRESFSSNNSADQDAQPPQDDFHCDSLDVELEEMSTTRYVSPVHIMDIHKKLSQRVNAKDVMLIELVKMKPELYDHCSPHYSDNEVKRKSWSEISKNMDCEGSKCKERWESLLAQYRYHEYLNKVSTNEQVDTSSLKWKYEDQMSFLPAFTKDNTRTLSFQDEAEKVDLNEDRNTTQGLCCEKTDDEEDKFSDVHLAFSQHEPRPRKRKLQQENTSASDMFLTYLLEKEKEKIPTDPTDTFFSLMTTTVKKFSPADQHLIKTKVFSLVNDIEAYYIHDQNGQTHTKRHQSDPLASTSPALPHLFSSSSTGTQHVQLHQPSNQESEQAQSVLQRSSTAQCLNQPEEIKEENFN